METYLFLNLSQLRERFSKKREDLSKMQEDQMQVLLPLSQFTFLVSPVFFQAAKKREGETLGAIFR
jgi:hypothetical protein